MDSVAGILENLPTTVIGIVALGTLIIGGITYAFFKNEHWALRLLSFLVIVLGFGLLVFAFVSNAALSIAEEDQVSEPAAGGGQIATDVAAERGSTLCAADDLECLTEQMELQKGNE